MELSGDIKKRISCMNTLPQELRIEIMSWLSIKHLCPLRFVSKTWFRLLTRNPQFAKLQFDRFVKSNTNPSIIEHSNNSNLLLATEHGSCQLPFFQTNNKYRLSSISDGLLCFNRGDNKEIFIWNPLIDVHITISCLPAPSSRFPVTSTGFAFGFDQHSYVYKLVRMFTEFEFVGKLDTCRTQISVHTIGLDTMWRTVQVDLPFLLHTSRIPPLVNGVLHWHIRTPHTLFYDIIYTFNLKREVIDELPPPSGIKFCEILELGGLLCVMAKTDGAEMQLGGLHWGVDKIDEAKMQIWVMKGYGLVSSWSKQYVIAKPQGYNYNMYSLGLTDSRDILLTNTWEKLVLYRPETNTVKDLKGFKGGVYCPYTYIRSIISPTVISRAGHN